MRSADENEFPLPSPLRGYTLFSKSDADAGALSIVPSRSNSEPYMVSIEPIVDMRHPNSITMCSASRHDAIVGAARMADESGIIDLGMGNPEGFDEDERWAWEQMRTKQDDLHRTTYEFGLGLGDDLRRDFEWWPFEINKRLTWSSAISSISKYLHQERVSNVQHRCFRLIDRNAGETVALVMRNMVLVNGEIINSDDIGDLGIRGRFVIFRDFWESGRYEDNWDQIILLSGLAVLAMTDRE